MLRAMAKRITWHQAAEILGMITRRGLGLMRLFRKLIRRLRRLNECQNRER